MKTETTYQRCPEASEFESYLKQNSSLEFKIAFEKHLDECKFCAEAIEGYKLSEITDITYTLLPANRKIAKELNHTTFPITQWAIAASVALLVGLSVFNFNANNKEHYTAQWQNMSNDLYASSSIEKSGHKKLVNNLNEQYWYLGENNVVAINDVIIDPSVMETMIKNNAPKEAIIVEIENTDFEYSNRIISQLKSTQQAPVFTF
jgi:hypothetical protein